MTALPLVLLGLPLAGCLVLTAWPRGRAERLAVAAGAVVGCAVLVVSAAVAVVFDHDRPGATQLETDLTWIPALDVSFHVGVDGVSLPLVLLTALLVACCVVHLVKVPPPGTRNTRGLVALVLLLETGMLGTFLALDLVLFFVFFEVVLVPMWFVIAYWGDPHDEPGRRRAATTFVLFTVLGSAVMLVGFLVLHANTGTFDLVVLTDRAGAGLTPTVQLVAAFAIGLGLAVKSPMWPLHIWLPDAHAKAPTIGSVLLAGVLLKMGTYGFIRVLLPVVPDGARAVAPYLAGLGVVGIVYGSLACLAQHDLKRLVAYSSVGHMGFVLLAVATLTPAGLNAALYANIAHGLITGLLFFLAGAVKDRYDSADLRVVGGGLYGRQPRLGALVAFGAVASLGLPGLAGFWGEMLAMLAAFDPAAGLPRPTYVVLMGLAGVGAVLTAGYLLLAVRRLCQGPDLAAGPNAPDATGHEVLVWSPLVALTVVLGLWPAGLLDLTDPAVRALLGAA